MGVFLTRGASLTIENLRIDLNDPQTSSMTLKVGYDVYPLWLSMASKQALEAVEIAAELDRLFDGKGSDAVTKLLENETAASMAAIVSAAAAIDAFYGSTLTRTKDQLVGVKKAKRSRGRHKVIAATLQQRYKIRSTVMSEFVSTLKLLFEIRHAALHAHGEAEEALMHPRFQLALSKKHVMFRADNAANAVRFALSVIGSLIGQPKARYPKLVEHCQFAREWVYPILDEWEQTQPTLSVKRIT